MIKVAVFWSCCKRCGIKWQSEEKARCPRCRREDYCEYLEDFEWRDA